MTKVFDNLDFQRGVQAFLTAMPAASLTAIRRGIRGFGPDNQTVITFESLMDSRSLFLTANTESIYAMAWLDLKSGPIVIESPPNTLGLVDDFWFRYVTDLGIAGPDKAIQQVGAGSAYAAAFVDAQKRPMDGGKAYRLHLPPKIPAAQFWSLVLYDNQTRSMLQTDAQFPSMGSQREGVVVNPDTSVDIYFGPKAPAGKESNWVQTWPGKGWNVILRLYGPQQSFFDKTWRPSEIEEVR